MSAARYVPIGYQDDEQVAMASGDPPSGTRKTGPWHRVGTTASYTGAGRLSTYRLVIILASLVVLVSLASAMQRTRALAAATRTPSKQLAGYDRGRWRPPNKVFTSQDVQTSWGMGPEAGHNANEGQFRPNAASSWVWEPVNGRKLRTFDPIDFLMRCLNSRAGLLIVGDSISSQQDIVLQNMLRLGSRHEVSPASNWLNSSLTNEFGIVQLTQDSTFRAYLREWLPHVPSERYDEPLIRFYRHDFLLDNQELLDLGHEIGLPPFSISHWLVRQSWVHGLPDSNAQGWKGEQSSIILVNTGAHWTRGEFDGLQQADIYKLAHGVANKLLKKLLAIPKLSVLYRSTTPGHFRCNEATTPVYPALPFNAHEQNGQWGWDTFGHVNDIWAQEMDRLAPSGWSSAPGATGSARGQVTFLNVTDMTGQRPDAHIHEKDCLHWALPGVPGWWNRLLWHALH